MQNVAVPMRSNSVFQTGVGLALELPRYKVPASNTTVRAKLVSC